MDDNRNEEKGASPEVRDNKRTAEAVSQSTRPYRLTTHRLRDWYREHRARGDAAGKPDRQTIDSHLKRVALTEEEWLKRYAKDN